MDILQAIEAANAHMLRTKGLRGWPKQVHLLSKTTAGGNWSVIYGPEVTFPHLFKEEDIVDGGEYILNVCNATGVVSEVDFSS